MRSTFNQRDCARPPSPCVAWQVICYVTMLLHAHPVAAQLDFEAPPVNYNKAEASNPVEDLNGLLRTGEQTLTFDDEHGYLKSVLDLLDVPDSSQMLVFSKTSFQLRRISRRRPRAIYFNDDVYVGWVQGGDTLEVSVADDHLGAVFYTLRQKPVDRPQLTRDRGQCTICHASARTSGVPGHLVRSVYPSSSGQPNFGAGTFTTDHRSPFKERWGGWFVSGTHGKLRHMGNVTADEEAPQSLDREAGANVRDLSDHVNTGPYLTNHSDIVALMVLEHQTRMHNLITRLNFETRSAQHYDAIMNKALERRADHRSESTTRRINSAAEKLVEYMLFSAEFPLSAAVAGTSTFAADFSKRGPRDSQGRSLRELDMKRRMMKYPCSYLIYSTPFDALPEAAKSRVYERLLEVLSGEDQSEAFAHLSTRDRGNILEILRDTKRDLPASWTHDAKHRVGTTVPNSLR